MCDSINYHRYNLGIWETMKFIHILKYEYRLADIVNQWSDHELLCKAFGAKIKTKSDLYIRICVKTVSTDFINN